MFFKMASRACMRRAAVVVHLASRPQLRGFERINFTKKAPCSFPGRHFCTLPKELQMLSKRGFSENAVVLDLRPIAVGDTGLNYRAGRLDGKMPPLPEIHKRPTGLFLVKIQPPLDNSGDARGGAGQMTPATLLVHNRQADLVQLVKEADRGHTALLRAALKTRGQVGYCYAGYLSGDRDKIRIFTNVVPPDEEVGW